MSISNTKNFLRKVTVMMSLAGVFMALLGGGITLLIVGLVGVGLVMMLPGSPYGDPPDPALAPNCPQCGLQMTFVQYLPGAEEYQCKDHGGFIDDYDEGLMPWPYDPSRDSGGAK